MVATAKPAIKSFLVDNAFMLFSSMWFLRNVK